MQTITLFGGTLFDVAARYLGDPNEWTLLADLNGIGDPWLSGIVTLQIPAFSTVNSLVQ